MYHSELKDMLGAVFTPKSSSVSSYRATVQAYLPQNLAAPNAEAFVPVSCICARDRDTHTGISIPKDQSNVIIPTSGNRLGQGHGMDTRGPRSHPRTRCHQPDAPAGGEVPSPAGGCRLAPCVITAPCAGAAPPALVLVRAGAAARGTRHGCPPQPPSFTGGKPAGNRRSYTPLARHSLDGRS